MSLSKPVPPKEVLLDRAAYSFAQAQSDFDLLRRSIAYSLDLAFAARENAGKGGRVAGNVGGKVAGGQNRNANGRPLNKVNFKSNQEQTSQTTSQTNQTRQNQRPGPNLLKIASTVTKPVKGFNNAVIKNVEKTSKPQMHVDNLGKSADNFLFVSEPEGESATASSGSASSSSTEDDESNKKPRENRGTRRRDSDTQQGSQQAGVDVDVDETPHEPIIAPITNVMTQAAADLSLLGQSIVYTVGGIEMPGLGDVQNVIPEMPVLPQLPQLPELPELPELNLFSPAGVVEGVESGEDGDGILERTDSESGAVGVPSFAIRSESKLLFMPEPVSSAASAAASDLESPPIRDSQNPNSPNMNLADYNLSGSEVDLRSHSAISNATYDAHHEISHHWTNETVDKGHGMHLVSQKVFPDVDKNMDGKNMEEIDLDRDSDLERWDWGGKDDGAVGKEGDVEGGTARSGSEDIDLRSHSAMSNQTYDAHHEISHHWINQSVQKGHERHLVSQRVFPDVDKEAVAGLDDAADGNAPSEELLSLERAGNETIEKKEETENDETEIPLENAESAPVGSAKTEVVERKVPVVIEGEQIELEPLPENSTELRPKRKGSVEMVTGKETEKLGQQIVKVRVNEDGVGELKDGEEGQEKAGEENAEVEDEEIPEQDYVEFLDLDASRRSVDKPSVSFIRVNNPLGSGIYAGPAGYTSESEVHFDDSVKKQTDTENAENDTENAENAENTENTDDHPPLNVEHYDYPHISASSILFHSVCSHLTDAIDTLSRACCGEPWSQEHLERNKNNFKAGQRSLTGSRATSKDGSTRYGHSHASSNSSTPLRKYGIFVFVAQTFMLFYVAFLLLYVPAQSLSMGSSSVLGWHFSMINSVINYFMCVNTEGGSIPKKDEDASWYDRRRVPEAEIPGSRVGSRVGSRSNSKTSAPGGLGMGVNSNSKETNPQSGPSSTPIYIENENIIWDERARAWKPERAHFDKNSQQIILKYDHYCPYVGRAIGLKNYKYFFLFLLYTSVSLNLFDSYVWQLLFSGPAEYGDYSLIAEVLLAGGATLGSVLSMLVTPFFFFHCFLTGRNMTTVEFLGRRGSGDCDEEVGVEGQGGGAKSAEDVANNHAGNNSEDPNNASEGVDGVPLSARKLSKGYVETPNEDHPFTSYDNGIYQNLQENLGHSPFFWLWPTVPEAAGGGGDENNKNAGLIYAKSHKITAAAAEIHCDVCECWSRLCSMVLDV